MHVAIRRYEGVTSTAEELVEAARLLSSNLSRMPGFVSFVVLEGEPTVFALINIFENQASLNEADRFLEILLADYPSTLLPKHYQRISGEVVLQKGL